MKPAPCKRHQPRSEGYTVNALQVAGRGASKPLRYAVYEHARCARCAAPLHRLLGTHRALDGWEAARMAGVPEADLATVSVRGEVAPAPTPAGPAVAVALSCWPFPVSTFYPTVRT